MPGSLTPSVVSSSEIDLSWSASTGGTGAISYLLERCTGASCTSFSQIANQSATTFADTGLSAATTYQYRVRATASGSMSSSTAARRVMAPVCQCSSIRPVESTMG